jgi:hypothetical protein
MTCEGCKKEIPKDQEKFLEIDGVHISVPFCEACAAEMKKKSKDYRKH